MEDQIKKEKFLDFPISDVWDAISNQEKISAWFIQADFKAEVGYGYKFTHEDTIITGEVKEVNPVNDLVYTWIISGTEVETTVRWTLEEKNGGTQLNLVHSGITSYDGSVAQNFFDNFSNGWDNCNENLEKYLIENVGEKV